MEFTDAYAPVALLQDRSITAAAKIVWLLINYDSSATGQSRISPTDLASRAGLARTTVYTSLTQLAESGWSSRFGYSQIRGNGPSRTHSVVRIPTDLLTEGSISAQARVLYGVLAHLTSEDGSGEFTYRTLAQMLQLDTRTVSRAIQELNLTGWLELAQANRRAPVLIRLRNPLKAQTLREVALAKRRIARAPFRGEAIMREYLSIIVDSEDFEDDAAPGFLINPLTNERLQFDRFYPTATPHPVAFEFNGPQHYGETNLFSAEEAAVQRARDLIKAGICAERRIALVVVHPHDLSLSGMTAKVGNLLPRRKVQVHHPLVEYMESIAASYRRAARRRFPVRGR